jgi:glycosyltransferase involved in cell wall biosynthesis
MAENTIPTTIWYSTIGTGDGHDYATRGYLSALMKSGYSGLRLSPMSYTSVLKTDKDLSMFEEIIKPPASARLKPLIRIQPGDPRIGTKITINGVEIEITEGSTDLEVRQEYTSPTRFEVKCVVIHHDPTSTCRQYAAMVKADRSPGVAYVAITVWEPSEIPSQIALVLSELDHIIVPSQHVREAFERSGVKCPMSVVPHSFNADRWPCPTQEELGQNRGGRFVFNTVATPIERKNLVGLMRVYFKAFEGFEDVVLRIKSNGDDSLFEQMLKEALAQAGISGRRPLVKIFRGKWSVDQIREFYLSSNCYVSATRGEGFGLPEMEASLCGRPVITTNWGAAPEVLAGRSHVYMVDYDLVPVSNMYGIGCYEPEQRWAAPKDDSLIEAMRAARKQGVVSDTSAWELMRSRFGEDVVGASLAAVLDAAQLDAAGEGGFDDGFAK